MHKPFVSRPNYSFSICTSNSCCMYLSMKNEIELNFHQQLLYFTQLQLDHYSAAKTHC